MALVSMRQLLDHAAEHDYGVPAFNVNNLEQIRAIMEGAAQTNSPVIVQASAGARKYAGGDASGSWRVTGFLSEKHPAWVLIGDDGWLVT